MKIVYNDLIPFKGFMAINICGTLYARNEYKGKISDIDINHEKIHSAQMKDLGFFLFYLIYFIEWIYRICTVGYQKAYRTISFEQEAYSNQNNLNYLKTRKKFAMWS